MINTPTGVEYVIFGKASANPTKPVIEEGGRFARENNCDFVVPLGGGNVLDASKAISLMAAKGGDLWDYVLFGTGKKPWPSKAALPIVAVTQILYFLISHRGQVLQVCNGAFL